MKKKRKNKRKKLVRGHLLDRKIQRKLIENKMILNLKKYQEKCKMKTKNINNYKCK